MIMKLVCNCGRELEFAKDEEYHNDPDFEEDEYEESIQCDKSNYEIMLNAEHDELWISCDCGNSIHLFA